MDNYLLILMPKTNKINLSILLTFFTALLNLARINCKTCKEINSLSETDCFNAIMELNMNNRCYRAGHFVTSKNNDLFIEYSGDGPTDYRLFYGLKENGRGYFNDSNVKEKQLVKSGSYIGRFESRNIMIHLYNNYNTEYIFSISAYQAVAELHDLENDNYLVADIDTFLGKRIFSYVYNILEAKEDGKPIYFIFYTSPVNNPNDNNGGLFYIKKLKFPEFKLDYDTSHLNAKYESKHNDRVISGFLFENDNAFGILYIDASAKSYKIRLFDFNLNEIGSSMLLYNKAMSNPEDGHGKYLQAVYLSDNVVAFFYFHTDYGPSNHNNALKFQVLKFTISSNSYSTSDKIFIHWNDFKFDDEIYLNDIYKIENDRLAFATTTSNTYLYILLIDFFNDYKSVKARYYHFSSPYTINKEFQLYSYNGYLVFTSTINSANYNSILMFFSYPNGTDFEIELAPYIINADDYSSSYNLYKYLNSTKKVENNIFGYKNVEKIRLVSIPEQLQFYPI